MTADSANIEAILPLTPVQEGMLFHALYAPESPLYFQQYTCSIEGDLDIDLLQQAWKLVIGRHAALRSFLTWEGRSRPLQIVRRQVEAEWSFEDWLDREPSERDEALEALLESDRTRGFQLDEAPLLRFTVIRITPVAHRFVWSHHHIIVDGWSMGVILEEVFAAYDAFVAGVRPALPPPPPLRDYVEWLNEHDAASSEEYWSDVLSGFEVPTKLQIEDPSIVEPWAVNHDEVSLLLSSQETSDLTRAARRMGVTLSTVLRGMLSIVLSRYSCHNDVLFGATVAGRPAELDGVLSMVGMFLNSIPVRVNVDPDAQVASWLESIQQTQVSAGPHEATPLVDIQRWSDVPVGEPLFQALLVVENVPNAGNAPTSLRLSDPHYLQRSNYPLAILVMPGSELEIVLLYDSDRYLGSLMRRLAGQMRSVLLALVRSPSAQLRSLEFFPPEEIEEISVDWNDTDVTSPSSAAINQLIHEAVDLNQDKLAVVCGDVAVTYSDLASAAASVTAGLRAADIGSGDRVAIMVNRSVASVSAIFGVLDSGAAYIPLDPNAPRERLRQLLNEADVKAVLFAPDFNPGPIQGLDIRLLAMDRRGRLTLDLGISASDVAQAWPNADDVAYVMFTSGSTGSPKGVVVSHRGLVNSTLARQLAYGDSIAGFLLVSPLIFDSSVAGLFSTLVGGGTLVIPEEGMEQDVMHLAGLIRTHQITHTLALPSLYDILLEHASDKDLATLNLVMVAGEACPPGLVGRHHDRLPGVRLANEYGPTEATVWCTFHVTSREDAFEDRVPIGKPIANMSAFIVDDAGRQVPVGVPGELLVGGPGIAQGYLDLPEQTAEKFIEWEPGVGAPIRVYKTGDRARFKEDGTIDLVGRADRQIKMRGIRIEPGEIEAVMRQHPEVSDAVVVAGTTGTSSSSLVGYAESAMNPDDLTEFLRERLPQVMIPAKVLCLVALPRGRTGKVDPAALPDPHPGQGSAPHITPTVELDGPTETTLARIWRDVLGVDDVGPHDNFFALGGDSILSIRIIARAHEAGLSFSPRQFFSYPTVSELAAIANGSAGS